MSDPALKEISRQIMGNQILQQSLIGQLFQLNTVIEQTAIRQIEEKAQAKTQGGFPGSHLDQNKFHAELKEYSENTILKYFSISAQSHLVIDCGQGETDATEKLVKIMKLQYIIKSVIDQKTSAASQQNSDKSLEDKQIPIVFTSPSEYYYNILPFVLSGCKIVLFEKTESGQINDASIQKKLAEYSDYKIQIVMFSAISYMKIINKVLTALQQHKEQMVQQGKMVFLVVDISKLCIFQQLDLQQPGYDVIDCILLHTQKILGGYDAANLLICKQSTYQVTSSPSFPDGYQIKQQIGESQYMIQDSVTTELGSKLNPLALYKAALCLEYLQNLPKEIMLAKQVETMKAFLQNINLINQELNKEATSETKKNILVNVVDDPLSIQLRFYGPSKELDPDKKPMYNVNLVASMLNDFYGIKTQSNFMCKSAKSVTMTNISSKQIAETIIKAHLPEYKDYQQGWVQMDLFCLWDDLEIQYIQTALKQLIQSADQVQSLYEQNNKTGYYQLKNSPSVSNQFSLNFKSKMLSKPVEESEKAKILQKQQQKINLIMQDPENSIPKLVESNNIQKMNEQPQLAEQSGNSKAPSEKAKSIIASEKNPNSERNSSIKVPAAEESKGQTKKKLTINLNRVPSIDSEDNPVQQRNQMQIPSKRDISPISRQPKTRKSQYQDFNENDLKVMTNILEQTRQKVNLANLEQMGSQRSLSSYVDSKILKEIDMSPTSPQSNFKRAQMKRLPSMMFNNSIESQSQRNKFLHQIFKVYQEADYMNLLKFWDFAEDFNFHEDLISKTTLRKICQECSPIARGMNFSTFMLALDHMAQYIYQNNLKLVTQTEKLMALYEYMGLDSPIKIKNILAEIFKTRGGKKAAQVQQQQQKDEQLQKQLEKLQNSYQIKYKKNDNLGEYGANNSQIAMQSNMSDIQQEIRYLKQSQLQVSNPIFQDQSHKRIKELEQQHENILQDLRRKQQQEYEIKQELYQQYLIKQQKEGKHKQSFSLIISRDLEKNSGQKIQKTQEQQQHQLQQPQILSTQSVKHLPKHNNKQEKKYYDLHQFQSLKRLNMKNNVDWQTIENASMSDYTAAIRERHFTPSMLVNEKDKDEYLEEYDLENDKIKAVKIHEEKQKIIENYGILKKKKRIPKQLGQQEESYTQRQHNQQDQQVDNEITKENQSKISKLQESPKQNINYLPRIHIKRKSNN